MRESQEVEQEEHCHDVKVWVATAEAQAASVAMYGTMGIRVVVLRYIL